MHVKMCSSLKYLFRGTDNYFFHTNMHSQTHRHTHMWSHIYTLLSLSMYMCVCAYIYIDKCVCLVGLPMGTRACAPNNSETPLLSSVIGILFPPPNILFP